MVSSLASGTEASSWGLLLGFCCRADDEQLHPLSCAPSTRMWGFRPPSGLCLLLLPPRIALGRCVPSRLCADCSRRHAGEAVGAAGKPGGAGGSWGLPGPVFSGSPRTQLPAGLQGTYFLFGRSSFVLLPGWGAEGKKGQGPG